MGKNFYASLRQECKKKLNFPNMKFPKIKAAQIDENIEMITSEDEDYIRLFKFGFIAKNELVDLLSGKRSL